jgi:type VI secretion system secreted protein VgrG
MKIHRPLWNEGALLAPQQFQQQSEWDALSRAGVAARGSAFPWGVGQIELDEAMLASGRVQAQSLRLWLPDDTLVDTRFSDLPPEPREIEAPASAGNGPVTVYVALPVMQVGIVNVQSDTVPAERPLRYREAWETIADRFGQEEESMAVARFNLAFRFGHEDNGAWDTCAVISPEDRVVTGSVSTRDYNYREALTPQDSSVTVRQEGGSTTGEVYHYAEPFLSEGDADTPEGGAWYTRLRHERYLNGQQTVTGRASSPVLAPGEVLEPQGSIPASLKDGIVITGIQTSGARDKGFQLHFTGIPYSETVCYRPALLKRPVVAGTLPARVESDEKHDTYAYLDNQGRYRVRLDFDRNSTEQGYAYLWLRMAKPYAGDTYGFHSPLLDGTEVSVMFDSGDPDRPYIAHAQHDSEHPDHVTRDNHTRNIWRTAGDNKFRLEDKRQEEHFKLATPYGKTQLNGGHVVDVRREPRGTGFELRTDEYGAVRAGRGMFLTADAQAKGEGQMLDMAPAVNRIKQANREMQALNNAAEAAKALVSDIQAQNNLLMQSIADLQAAVLLASAPQGIAFTSGEHLQLTSTQNTMLTAGKHIDMGAMKNISMSAENELGLFAHKAGVRMIANLGDVEMHSRHNTLDMSAQKELTITSTDDEIVISTPKTLTVNGGGSYLKLSDSGIEHGSKGDLTMKVGEYLVPGSGDDMPFSAPDFNSTEIAEIKRVISKPLSN